MTVTISIPDEIATKLRERASASGEPISEYTSRLVEQAVKSPTLEELLAPVQRDFARTGMTEAEFLEFGQNLMEKVRSEKKG
jgi:predicted transcriptional regulator